MILSGAGTPPDGFTGRFARFAIVGGIGFVLDAGLLWLLNARAGFDPYSARMISILVAMTCTWRLNRTVTFGPSSAGQAREGARYGGVGIATALLNYGIYSLLVWAVPGLAPVAATAIASAAAMLASFFGYARLVFGR